MKLKQDAQGFWVVDGGRVTLNKPYWAIWGEEKMKQGPEGNPGVQTSGFF